MAHLRRVLIAFLVFFIAPIGVSAALWHFNDPDVPWRERDRASAGLLPDPATHREAVVRIFAAPTVRWRGIFSVHSWVVVKPEGARDYRRYDKTGWGDPIRIDGFPADGRWFGATPQVVFAADGPQAEALIPGIEAAIADYPFARRGDYRAWPGPNSNTFVAWIIDRTPGVDARLPPNAIGRDFPTDGRWFAVSGSGLRLNFGGYGGVAVGWREGLEVNVLGAVAGIDVRDPGVKLPGLGRIGP